MPRSKALSQYPQADFLRLFDLARTEVVRLELPHIDALSLRGSLHGFRAACNRDPESARRAGINISNLNEVIVKKKDWGLELSNRNTTGMKPEIRQALDAVLGKARATPVPEQDEASRSLLAAIQPKANPFGDPE